MNRRRIFMLAIVMAVIVSGCSDRLDLEDAAIPLLGGYDLDENNKELNFVVMPVFSKSAEKKSKEFGVHVQTVRQGRGELDAYTPGIFQGRKLIVILVGKRLLQHPGWFKIMDVFFRDAKNNLTSRVVMYDGPLSEVISSNPQDQPFLPVLLKGMVDTKSARSETVKTTMQGLHRQIYEKGMTPYIAEIRMDNEIKLSGTALLDHTGKYIASLDAEETIYMQILQNEAKKTVSLTLSIPGYPKRGPLNSDKLSFSSERIKTKVKTSYSDDKFRFDLSIKMPIALTERLFPYDMRKKGAELEQLIAEQLQKKFEDLIRNVQKHKIDPFGFGVYAQAFEYKQYKKVEDYWGETFAQADVHVSVKVILESMGPMK